MNIKTINQLEETNVLDNHWGIATDIEGNVKKYALNQPIIYGDTENSILINNSDSLMISKNGVSLGSNNIVGLKGWYYDSIYKKSNTQIYVYLTDKQIFPETHEDLKTEEQIPNPSLPNLYELLGEGVLMSVMNDIKYDNKFILVGGGNGYVILDTADGSALPFDKIQAEMNLAPEDYSIYCLSKPYEGMADIGISSFAAGAYTYATNGYATAFGNNNHAFGKFSFVEGRDSKAAYASHAEGRENYALGDQSHAEGLRNITYGNNSHAEGNLNIIRSVASHAEGRGNVISTNPNDTPTGTASTPGNLNYSHIEGLSNELRNGYASHIEGQNNKLFGNYGHMEGMNNEGGNTSTIINGVHLEGVRNKSLSSGTHIEGADNSILENASHSHVEGRYNVATNPREHAEGIYNKSNKNTIHSVGIGKAGTSSEPDKNRKNAHEIMTNGKHYILGLGNYDGTNPDVATDLVTYIHTLETRIQQLENA